MKATRRTLLLGGLGATAAAALPGISPAHPNAVTVGSPVDPSFFGLHDNTGDSFSRLAPGAIRLWDVGLQWREIETKQGVYDWTHFDNLMTWFNVGHTGAPKVTYVLGQTPQFYSTHPTDQHYYTYPPADPSRFDVYARAVAARYTGLIDCYQVWNEANNTMFWNGGYASMAQLTQVAATAVKATDPKALIVAPSGPVRLSGEQDWLGTYYNTLVPGSTTDKAWKYFDRVGFSMYPKVREGPEAMLGLLSAMKTQMNNAAMPAAKQIPHASEINYDVSGIGDATLLSDAGQIAFTMRTYLVGAIAGFERMHWYRYDWGLDKVSGKPYANTYWTLPSDYTTLTPAGLAFTRIKGWMSSRTYHGYTTDVFGGYAAEFGSKTVAWNPHGISVIQPTSGTVITRCDGSQVVANGLVYTVQNPTMY